MKNLKKLLCFFALVLFFVSCSDKSNPVDNTPDWSAQIKGKWAGTGIYNGTDTIHILMIVDAVKNVITGNADVSYNSENAYVYTVKGKIDNQTITLDINSPKGLMKYTGTFMATNPGIIEGIMLDTRFGTMNVIFQRRFT